MKERKPNQKEIAAMWLYHVEYAKSGLGAIRFYAQLTDSAKKVVDSMIEDICGKRKEARR